MYISNIIYTYTNNIPARTAQGGGGSFKDRKPIEGVGCCDAWMADHPLMDRKVVGASAYLSVYLFACVTS